MQQRCKKTAYSFFSWKMSAENLRDSWRILKSLSFEYQNSPRKNSKKNHEASFRIPKDAERILQSPEENLGYRRIQIESKENPKRIQRVMKQSLRIFLGLS